MRRLLACTTAVFLLTAALGCHHIAGICDCDPNGGGCCGPTAAAHPGVKIESTHTEPIKVMPKASDTGK